MGSEQPHLSTGHPPQTVADVYARMKSREETDNVLKSHRLSEAVKSVAGGAVGGAAMPLLMSTPSALSELNADGVLREAVKHQVQQAVESAYLKGNVEPTLASTASRDLVNRVIGTTPSAEALSEFNHVLNVARGLGVHIPEPSTIQPSLLDILGVYGRSLKGPMSRAALPAAIGGLVGGALGANQYNKRLGERKKLLSELDKVKTSSELPMKVSLVANASYWNEVGAIEKAQGLQKNASLGAITGAVGGGYLAGRSVHKEKKSSDLRLEILQAAFADELEKLGHEKTAIWGAIRKMFGSGADNALQGIAQRGAAAEAARFGVPKQVIGPAGSGQPLGRSAAEVQKILSQRRMGGIQEAVNQRALSASPAQRQSMIRARAGTEMLSPGGRVDFGNNPVTFPAR